MEMFSLFDFLKCFLNYMFFMELKSIERKSVYISILTKYTTNSCQSVTWYQGLSETKTMERYVATCIVFACKIKKLDSQTKKKKKKILIDEKIILSVQWSCMVCYPFKGLENYHRLQIYLVWEILSMRWKIGKKGNWLTISYSSSHLPYLAIEVSIMLTFGLMMHTL